MHLGNEDGVTGKTGHRKGSHGLDCTGKKDREDEGMYVRSYIFELLG